MHTIYAGLHLPNKANEFLEIEEVDFEQDIKQLKSIIAARTNYDADKLELIYHGLVLKDDAKLQATVRPKSIIHCFPKTSKFEAYTPKPEILTEENIKKAQELLLVIANVQISTQCRVNILQKILAEFPEFRRDLGALILLRDSVLFNTLHKPEVVRKLAEHHPIIIEAAPLIVSTVKRELAKGTTQSEQATDSANSSDEENDRGRDDASTSRSQSDSARLRLISRQQLEAALAEITFSSVNSLSNIAQRNSEASADGSSSNLTTSASDERISASMLRSRLQRVFDSFEQRDSAPVDATTGATSGASIQASPTAGVAGASASVSASASASASAPTDSDSVLPMETNEQSNQPSLQITPTSDNGDIPLTFQNHMYAEQLRTMAQMGFTDHLENLNYLYMANGNIEAAINLLMAALS